MLEPQNKYLVFAIAYLTISLVFYILHTIIVYIFYMIDIPVCFTYIFALDCLLTLVFNQESHSGTSTLNLEES